MNITAAFPILRNRVAPLFNYSSAFFVVRLGEDGVAETRTIARDQLNGASVIEILLQQGVRMIVCGGIERKDQRRLEEEGFQVICNVTGTVEEIITALVEDRLEPWFGYETSKLDPGMEKTESPFPFLAPQVSPYSSCLINCVECNERTCCMSQGCVTFTDTPRHEFVSNRDHNHSYYLTSLSGAPISRLEDATEYIHTLRSQRAGIVFCTAVFDDMEWILEQFEPPIQLFPICCQFGRRKEQLSITVDEPACDANNMVRILNDANCDIVITVGPCFQFNQTLDRSSRAPVITIMGKDTLACKNLFPEETACEGRYSWRLNHCLKKG